MIVWIDAQISPYLAQWMESDLGVEAKPIRDLGLRDASDRQIFMAARDANAAVLTKDFDFVLLLEQHGPPPQVIWLTIGNTSNAHLKRILLTRLDPALELIGKGEPLVEISERMV